VLEATIQAGHELVNSRRVSNETLNRIQQPIIDNQTFAQIGNLYWMTCIAEGVTPKEFKDKNMAPRPDSIESFMLSFPLVLILKQPVRERQFCNLTFLVKWQNHATL